MIIQVHEHGLAFEQALCFWRGPFDASHHGKEVERGKQACAEGGGIQGRDGRAGFPQQQFVLTVIDLMCVS